MVADYFIETSSGIRNPERQSTVNVPTGVVGIHSYVIDNDKGHASLVCDVHLYCTDNVGGRHHGERYTELVPPKSKVVVTRFTYGTEHYSKPLQVRWKSVTRITTAEGTFSAEDECEFTVFPGEVPANERKRIDVTVGRQKPSEHWWWGRYVFEDSSLGGRCTVRNYNRELQEGDHFKAIEVTETDYREVGGDSNVFLDR